MIILRKGEGGGGVIQEYLMWGVYTGIFGMGGLYRNIWCGGFIQEYLVWGFIQEYLVWGVIQEYLMWGFIQEYLVWGVYTGIFGVGEMSGMPFFFFFLFLFFFFFFVPLLHSIIKLVGEDLD